MGAHKFLTEEARSHGIMPPKRDGGIAPNSEGAAKAGPAATSHRFKNTRGDVGTRRPSFLEKHKKDARGSWVFGGLC